jgi:PAS domain S-box-containing protein
VTLLYAVLGLAWIFGSDAAMGRLAPDASHLLAVSLLKGIAFILVTSTAVFFLLRRWAARQRALYEVHVRSEVRFQGQYQAIPVPTFTWRQSADDLVLQDCNTAAQETVGLSGQDLLGTSAAQFYAAAPATLKLLKDCFQQMGTGVATEQLPVRGGSTLRWHESHVAFVAPDLVLQHAIDIHDRHEAEVERVRVQEELRRTAGLLDTIFEEAPIGFAFVDRDLRYVRSNRRLAEITLVPTEDRIGKLVESFGGISNQLSEDCRQVLESATPFSKEVAFNLPDPGAPSALWIGGFPVRSGPGEATGIGLIVEDISERKRAADALEHTVALLRATLDSTAQGIYVVDLEGRVVVSNRKLRELFGLPPEQPLAGREVAALHESFRPLLEDPDAIEFAGTDPAREEHDVIRLKDGRILERRATPHYVGGRVAGRVGSFTDVTERRRAELALRESEARFRLMVEGSEQVFFYIHDRGGCFEYVSPSVRAVLGYGPEELIGQTHDWLIPAEVSGAEVRERTEGALASGVSGPPYTIVNRHRDGRLVTLEVTESPLIDGGRVVGVQGFARDVTQRRQLEDELRQAQKMEAIGRLAGGVAHDFNNILTVINGSVHVALELAGEHPEMRRLLGDIHTAAERAATLTRQLLAFGRKQVLQPRAVDLNQLILATGRMLKRVIGEDISLAVERDPRVRSTWADPGQVEQVLMNLVVNARDAMPDGGTLRIRTFPTTLLEPPPPVRPGDFTVLEVSDSGMGIAPDVLPRIFEPFFTTKSTGGGTGLGLATVYGVLRQTGGFVTVTSHQGAGATFRAYFTVYEGKEEGPAPTPRPGTPARGTERILVVEDEPAVRRLVRAVLERYGYEILDAKDGRDGLRVVLEQRRPLDLILSDVVMPGMSGPEFLQQCRGLCPETRLALMSGYAGNRLAEAAGDLERVPVLEKPFEPAELARIVRSILDGPPTGATVGVPPTDGEDHPPTTDPAPPEPTPP